MTIFLGGKLAQLMESCGRIGRRSFGGPELDRGSVRNGGSQVDAQDSPRTCQWRPGTTRPLAPFHRRGRQAAGGALGANGSPGPADSPDASDLSPPLPLGTLPVGTFVTDQFENDGIIFSGQSPFITDDGSSDINPTLSGTPQFQGTVVGTFVKPGTTKPATVDKFSIDVGFINSPDSTQMTVYDSKHQQLGVLVATQSGFNQLFSTFPGAASFSVSSVADEPAGWEINTIQIGPIADNYTALGDSYSSGEGTRDFPWSQSQGTQCDTGPLAWPVQMADAQNSSGVNGKLTIGPKTLIACQGEVMADLPNTRAGEKVSELGQLHQYFVDHKAPPDLVTLTIGGNDVDFSGILTDCFLGGAEVCLFVVRRLDDMLTNDSAALVFKLAHTYQAVKANAGGQTQVVVAGYPDLFPQPGGFSRAFNVYDNCPWLRSSISFILTDFPVISPFTGQLLQDMEHAQASLNADIAAAASIAGVQFVPIPFVWSGHEMCTDDPWINPLNPFEAGIISNNRNSGHPTVTGSAAIAAAVGSAIGLAGSQSPQARFAAPVPPARFSDLSTPAAQAAITAQLGMRPAKLGVTGGRLLAGTVGAAYLDFLISTGGAGSQTWKIAKGKLPPGLKLSPSDGTITGTPLKAGKYTFQAQVTNVAGKTRKTARAAESITIGKPGTLKILATKPEARHRRPGLFLHARGQRRAGLGDLGGYQGHPAGRPAPRCRDRPGVRSAVESRSLRLHRVGDRQLQAPPGRQGRRVHHDRRRLGGTQGHHDHPGQDHRRSGLWHRADLGRRQGRRPVVYPVGNLPARSVA